MSTPRLPSSLCILLAPLLLLASPASGEETIAHDLQVSLDPAAHRLTVRDEITIPDRKQAPVEFELHAGLEPSIGPGWAIETISTEERLPGLPLTRYRARPTTPDTPLVLAYAGEISHPLQTAGEEYARSFRATPGTIAPEGVYLSGTTHWLPTFADRMVTFRIEIRLPSGWDAITQGRRESHRRESAETIVTWIGENPGEEVYLIAGPWTEYSRAAGSITARVFLRTPEPGLAARYLEATAQYVQMYSRLLGPYPYDSFALVENFWETGYGMPSFTLLGPKIIRFPFILHSSYPHEILHNWWGNSVYVAARGGNWCEGLTAYLADHLIKEGRGQGSTYRRDTLEKYRSYVSSGEDFALQDFRSRHSGASEAVGYGKGLMFWHMLRRQLGDEDFVHALRRFYRAHRFQRASYADIESSFRQTSGRELGPIFEQWIQRTGAPELSLAVRVPDGGEGWHIRVEQVQDGDPYHLEVPVRLGIDGEEAGRTLTARFTLTPDGKAVERTVEWTLPAETALTSVQVDPDFDLFRRLAPQEVPPSIGDLFGAEKMTVVTSGNDGARDASILARAWGGPGGEGIEIVSAESIDHLPSGAVWILGANNPWAEGIRRSATARGTRIDTDRLSFGEEGVSTGGHAFVLTERHPEDPEATIGWIGATVPGSLPGLARKLPHYGKYSYLAFAGEEPTNVIKGQYEALSSPLFWRATRNATLPDRPPEQPLARLEPVFDPDRLQAHVDFLASDELAGRGVGSEGIDRAAEYIIHAFSEAGLRPGGEDGGWYQTWSAPDGPEGRPIVLRNVIGVLPGQKEELAGQSVIVSAHHDHLGTGWPDVRSGNAGKIHNGADDNASGVSVLIELATHLARTLPTPDRAIVFVAFTGEEWGLAGSRHYVDAMKTWPATQATSVVNLDTVGRLSGRRLLVLGTATATEWIHIVRGIGFTTGIEAVAVAEDPGGSDQKTFHEIGVPGIQLTTGATEDYHRPTDRPGKIDADGLVRVSTWTREAVVYLATRPTPLTSTLEVGDRSAPPQAPARGRRVLVGTVPDFADPGPGIRVESVVANSPAEEAGLQGGDRILSIDGNQMTDLRTYSRLLRQREPGETITLGIDRDGDRLEIEVELRAR